MTTGPGPSGRARQHPRDVQAWLRSGPSAEELRIEFPHEWASVRSAIVDILERQDYDALRTMALAVARPGGSQRRRARSPAEQQQLIRAHIERQLAQQALADVRIALATGVTEGKVRFNRYNGWILQRLLFAHDLERKPVSMFWFRFWWPLLPQRRILMTLVAPKGIYCFYSRRLIKRLAELIGDRPCLEVAAGDGTLSRFLRDAGVTITATDNHSWSDRVEVKAEVLRQDARVALRVHEPAVVICSWPPAGNSFEQAVFQTPSVEMYIVISTHHEWSSGNWNAYRQQRTFERTEDPELSRLALPPELEPIVLVFRRRSA